MEHADFYLELFRENELDVFRDENHINAACPDLVDQQERVHHVPAKIDICKVYSYYDSQVCNYGFSFLNEDGCSLVGIFLYLLSTHYVECWVEFNTVIWGGIYRDRAYLFSKILLFLLLFK